MTTSNTSYNTATAGQPKTITKIVTFYSDGTFSEFVPSPYNQWNPYTVPYQPHYPYAPYWQQQVFCGVPNSNSQMWSTINTSTTPKNETQHGNT